MANSICITFPSEVVTELREHGVKNLSEFFRQCADKELNKFRGTAAKQHSAGSTSLSQRRAL